MAQRVGLLRKVVACLHQYINLPGTRTWTVPAETVQMCVEEEDFGIAAAIAPYQLAATLPKDQDLRQPKEGDRYTSWAGTTWTLATGAY